MSVISFSKVFLVLCNDIKCFQRSSCIKQEKKQKIIGVKSFWVKYNYRFEFTKKYISKFFIKMFLKKTE